MIQPQQQLNNAIEEENKAPGENSDNKDEAYHLREYKYREKVQALLIKNKHDSYCASNDLQ